MAAPHAAPVRRAIFRFYAQLGDHLPPWRRGVSFEHAFTGSPAVKDVIEALGVPHGEVDLVLANGRAEPFRYRLRHGDRVSVFPAFRSLDISPRPRLRPPRPDVPRFLLDVHLARLARYLRLLGFDTTLDPALDDPELADLAVEEGRILLTRDRGLLKRGTVVHGYWVRATDSRAQLAEVVASLDLARLARPFSRCMACNGRLAAAAKSDIARRLPPRTRLDHDDFQTCAACGRLYWRGSHFQHMRALVTEVVGEGWAG